MKRASRWERGAGVRSVSPRARKGKSCWPLTSGKGRTENQAGPEPPTAADLVFTNLRDTVRRRPSILAEL